MTYFNVGDHIRKPEIHVKIHVRFVEKKLKNPQIEKTAKNERNPSRNGDMRAILSKSLKMRFSVEFSVTT